MRSGVRLAALKNSVRSASNVRALTASGLRRFERAARVDPPYHAEQPGSGLGRQIVIAGGALDCQANGLWRVAFTDAAVGPNEIRQWKIGDIAAVGDAPPFEHRHARRCGHVLRALVQQTRFPDSRFADDADGLTLAGADAGCEIAENRQFVLPADEGCQRSCKSGRPRVGSAKQTHDAEHWSGRSVTPTRDCLDVAIDRAASRVADQHHAG